MSRRRARHPVRNAGAFGSPFGLIPAPMHTLSDDYQDTPTDPEDDRVPEPEPPGLIHRLVERFRRRPKDR